MPRSDNAKRGGLAAGGGSSRGFRGGYRGGRGNFRGGARGGFYGGGDGWAGPPRGFRGGGFRGRRGFKGTHPLEPDRKRPKLEVGERLKEVDIGVTEFVGDHDGFAGVVKERYADFHVHEINLLGEIAKLTGQTIPPEPEELEDLEDMKRNIPQDIWDQLEMLMEADSLINSVEINVTEMDKDQRRAIHAIAKKIPQTVSQTVDQGENKMIVVAKANKQKFTGHKFRRDQRQDWGRRGGNYCHFLLHKVNMDTMDALNQMAMCLRIKSNMFNYAGTKDRRARTTQWVSLKKISPIHILEAGKAVRGAYVGNFKFTDEPLRLGLLSGNRFRIALRTITGSDVEIEKAMTSLRDNGFINYYGLQRFGTVAAIPTHHVGRALLQGKWNDAIELILKPRVGEQQRDLIEARELYQKTRDPLAAFERIGRPDKLEAKLLWGLHLCGEKNPQGALDWIPRNTGLMYIHAYQSYIWNHMVSRRIRELGLKPVVGDLVYENPNFKEESEALDYGPQDNDKEIDTEKKRKEDLKGQQRQKNDDREESREREVEEKSEEQKVQSADDEEENEGRKREVNSDKSETEGNEEADVKNSEDEKSGKKAEEEASEARNNENPDEPMECTDAADAIDKEKDGENRSSSLEEEKTEDSHSLPAVKILEEADLPNYTLADVVMPQPGWRVTYPPYAKPWFDEILAKDELTTDLRQKNKKYSLGGAYRKILEVPADLSWRVMRYKERYDELILCDVDEMRGLPPPKDDPDGKYRALIVEMSLKPCTYATMALREILKCDTSPQTQAAQSAKHKAQEEEEEKKKREEEEKEKNELSENEENKDVKINMEKEEDKDDESEKIEDGGKKLKKEENEDEEKEIKMKENEDKDNGETEEKTADAGSDQNGAARKGKIEEEGEEETKTSSCKRAKNDSNLVDES